jgi:hypothetical protein
MGDDLHAVVMEQEVLLERGKPNPLGGEKNLDTQSHAGFETIIVVAHFNADIGMFPVHPDAMTVERLLLIHLAPGAA